MTQVMDQLTIFDVIDGFDESQAYWKDVLGAFEICLVKAFIPKDALSSLETWKKYDKNEQKRMFDVWHDHAYAIYSAGYSWDSARDLLKKHREEGTPGIMGLYRYKNGKGFRPARVAEYLPMTK